MKKQHTIKSMLLALLCLGTTMCFGRGIYLLSSGDFRIPDATAKIVATNSDPFVFTTYLHARQPFSIRVGRFSEFRFNGGIYTNLMLQCEQPGTYAVRIYDPQKDIYTINFQNCKCIKEFTFPEYCNNNGYWGEPFKNSSVEYVKLPTNATYIGASMFKGCKNLHEIDIPNTVTSISGLAFGYSGLVKITIPDSVTSMGDQCFEGCATNVTLGTHSLLKVKLSDSMTTIPAGCFNACNWLNTVILPSNLKTINGNAFTGNYVLSNITFTTSIESIATTAFNSCRGLRHIHFTGTLEQYKANSALVGAFGTVPEGVEPVDNSIQLNSDGLFNDSNSYYSKPPKTLHFNAPSDRNTTL